VSIERNISTSYSTVLLVLDRFIHGEWRDRGSIANKYEKHIHERNTNRGDGGLIDWTTELVDIACVLVLYGRHVPDEMGGRHVHCIWMVSMASGCTRDAIRCLKSVTVRPLQCLSASLVAVDGCLS